MSEKNIFSLSPAFLETECGRGDDRDKNILKHVKALCEIIFRCMLLDAHYSKCAWELCLILILFDNLDADFC